MIWDGERLEEGLKVLGWGKGDWAVLRYAVKSGRGGVGG